MDACCCPPPISGRQACPGCGRLAAVVEPQTVKALLIETALRRFEIDAYYFCVSPTCELVYFNLGGGRFSTTDLRVLVWQKEPGGHRTICYCFGEREDHIQDEIERTGASGALSRVRAHIEARRCACDVRNPRGVCCLGDLTGAVTRIQRSVRSEVSQ